MFLHSFVEKELKKHHVAACERWGFDFAAGAPMAEHKQYTWERVPPTNTVPEMYTLSRAAHIRDVRLLAAAAAAAAAATTDTNNYNDLLDERAERSNRIPTIIEIESIAAAVTKSAVQQQQQQSTVEMASSSESVNAATAAAATVATTATIESTTSTTTATANVTLSPMRLRQSTSEKRQPKITGKFFFVIILEVSVK